MTPPEIRTLGKPEKDRGGADENLWPSSATLSKTAKNSVRARLGRVLGGNAGGALGFEVPSRAYLERAAAELESPQRVPIASSGAPGAQDLLRAGKTSSQPTKPSLY